MTFQSSSDAVGSENAMALAAGADASVAGDQFDKAVEQLTMFDMDIVHATTRQTQSSIALSKADSAYMVQLDDLRVMEDFNPRIDDADLEAHIESICQSMLDRGFDPSRPLTVISILDGKRPRLHIVDGHCRFRAAKLAVQRGAQFDEVPVVVVSSSVSMEDITASLFSWNRGRPMSPLEAAIICKRLSGMGWSNARIAQTVPCSPEYVGQLLRVIGGPRAVREMIHKGQLSLNTALKALRDHGSDAQAVLEKGLQENGGKLKPKQVDNTPQGRQIRVCKQYGVQMYETISKISQHSAFASLPDDLRGLVDELLTTVDNKCKEKDKKEKDKKQKAAKPEKSSAASVNAGKRQGKVGKSHTNASGAQPAAA